MHKRALQLSVLSLAAVALSACLPANPGPDASSTDGGSWTPDSATPPSNADASTGHDADSPPLVDAGSPAEPDADTPDSGSVTPDAGDEPDPEPDAGGGGGGHGADLIVEFADVEQAVSFRNIVIGEDDCELYEGCVGGQGPRALIEVEFNLANIGDAPIDLGRPFEDPLFYPSFCQDSYVIDGFFAAELRDEAGTVVAQGRMSTSCIAGALGGYTCRAQGLGIGDSSPQPLGRCDFLDVTSVPAGDYTLAITANPDRVVDESDFDNNRAEIAIYYAACPGTVCGGTCCPAGVACEQGVCMLPDLRVSESSAAGSLFFTHQTFGENSCELEEMCVSGGGRRRLLEFEGRIENWGPGDLNPGPEANNPLFEYSACHEHYHFRDFTDYRLLNLDGSVAAQGHKQSFCLVSMEQVEGAPTPGPHGVHPPPGETGCSLLHAGWADIYGVGTPCQWVDITDVASGDYILELAVNPLGRVAEADLTNNVVQIPVHVADETPCSDTEICGDDIDQDCDDQPDEWDEDCQTCFPGDPFCTPDTPPITGNDTCDQAYEMTEQAMYSSVIADNASDVAPSCGGEGGDVFFSFTLDSEQIVYLGALESELDTVLVLYAGDCSGEELRCQDDACSGYQSQFAQRLAAGHYVVGVKAKQASDGGTIRLKFQHADATGVILLDQAGVYAGDTRLADDSTDACAFSGFPDEDGGVDTGGGGGSVMSGSGGTSGIAGGDPASGLTGKDDVYAVAKCRSPLIASTCGTAAFDSMLEARSGSADGEVQNCSDYYGLCESDPNGAVIVAYAPAGLAFIVVDGNGPDAAGEYQMSVLY